MTTLTTIVNNAFRESGITAVGTTPDSNESAEAVTILINFINSLYFDEIGEHLTNYDVGTNGITYGPDYDQRITTVAKTNSRLICNLTGATTLYLPPVPHDGALLALIDTSNNFASYNLTLNGNGRLIDGGTTAVCNTNGYRNLLMFDGASANWVSVPTLASGSDSSPFGTRWDDLLVMAVMMRINPRYGADTHPETIQAFNRLLKQFKRRFSHTEEASSERGITRLPGNPYSKVWDFNSFNLGR